MSCVEELTSKLQKYLNIHFDVRLNENHTTMLSLLERKKRYARLSIHKMFLEAPETVIRAIAAYVKGDRTEEKGVIRHFIQQKMRELDSTSSLRRLNLENEGNIYNLSEIYHSLNHEYFANQLHLHITWYASTRRKPKSRLTYGQYVDHLRLIKIHRILDSSFFPEYFVRYIVYHEMVHHVVPGYFDEKGRFCIHGKEFKKREQAYKEYKQAIAWERSYKYQIFAR